jgi:hypothetical protein
MSCDTRIGALAGASALAHPVRGRLGLTVRGSDVDVAAKADHVAEAQRGQEGEQLLIAEAAVGRDGHAATGGEQFGEAAQAGILETVALLRQFVLR